MSVSTAKVGIVILAAGDGTRMESRTPKVMHQLHGRPLIEYVVNSAEQAVPGSKPVVVVCANHTLVQDYLGTRVEYAVQPKQRGTADAVRAAALLLAGRVSEVVVLYGDMPFIATSSIRRLIAWQRESGATLTILTVTVPDFTLWRAAFNDFGRILRDPAGQVKGIREAKDATPEELAITELNTSYFCFQAAWLWKNLARLDNNNAQGEYYLTDLVQLAIEQGECVETIGIDPREALGVNTAEQLAAAEALPAA